MHSIINRIHTLSLCIAGGIVLVLLPATLVAGEPVSRGPVATTWDQAYARMQPWKGTREQGGADPSTMDGKVVVGYQGWFAAKGDGSGLGWRHYGGESWGPGNCSFEMWPDMSETTPAERYPTRFNNADSAPADIYSSYNPATVDRHFKWMKENGIDGAFLQRFVSVLKDPREYDFRTAITDNVRNAANKYGRTWCVMYDLSGFNPTKDGTELILRDWKESMDRMAITKDPGYQHCHGKPLVVLWGVGFPGRKYSVADADKLVDFLKNDATYGGNSIMLGVPYGWRNGVRDAVPSPELLALIRKADIVSPWTVGRYGSAQDFIRTIPAFPKGDMDWCAAAKVDYLPVIFPGFSWKNLMKSRKQDPGHTIHRGDGTFYWTQGSQLLKSGAKMLYVAMFDEVDEATAILKTSNTPPAGQESVFVTNEAGAPDHYLWLTSKLAEALHTRTIPQDALPQRDLTKKSP